MAQGKGFDRRKFLLALSAMPAVGALAAFTAPLLRFLKPNLDPGLGLPEGRLRTLAEMDLPKGDELVLGPIEEIREPWSSRFFVFTKRFVQYTPQEVRVRTIPGVAIKLPWKVDFPGFKRGEEPSDIVAFSRVCPHLGCIFKYVRNWREITAAFGGWVPPEDRRHALMGCPCHLSVFDPADRDQPGRVLSGPATRPPFYFVYEIKDGVLVITDAEPGGIG
jgi:Rieske Fe-S protein